VVVAATLTHGIGKDNTLPWRLPGDLAHFKAITSTTHPGKRNAVVRCHRPARVSSRPSILRVSLAIQSTPREYENAREGARPRSAGG
jgi:hypothetical protein